MRDLIAARSSALAARRCGSNMMAEEQGDQFADDGGSVGHRLDVAAINRADWKRSATFAGERSRVSFMLDPG